MENDETNRHLERIAKNSAFQTWVIMAGLIAAAALIAIQNT